MELSEFTDVQLIEELRERNYEVCETEEENDDISIDDFDDDDLIFELGSRGYDIYDESGNCVSDFKKEPHYKEDHFSEEYILPREFDRHQLHAHLVNITGLGGYASNSELLEEVKRLLEL